MGLGGINIWQLLIILLIVVVIFGTKKLKTLGGDLGGAVKSFRGAINEAEKAQLEAERGEDEPAEAKQSRETADS